MMVLQLLAAAMAMEEALEVSITTSAHLRHEPFGTDELERLLPIVESKAFSACNTDDISEPTCRCTFCRSGIASIVNHRAGLCTPQPSIPNGDTQCSRRKRTPPLYSKLKQFRNNTKSTGSNVQSICKRHIWTRSASRDRSSMSPIPARN